MNTSKKVVITFIVAVLLFGAAYGIAQQSSNNDESGQNVTEDQQQTEDTQDTPTTDDTEDTEVKEDVNTPSDPEKIKNPVVKVNEQPVVATGYGNVAAKPLPRGQETSTTCTTDANVECIVTFTNVDSDQVVTFAAQTTDFEGVAIWYWTGGEDVGSGTWRVQATAGNKTSNTSTIYVQ